MGEERELSDSGLNQTDDSLDSYSESSSDDFSGGLKIPYVSCCKNLTGRILPTLKAPTDREIQIQWQNQKWNKNAWSTFKIKKKTQSIAYELTLKTFYEVRREFEKCEPSVSQTDLDNRGLVPDVWRVGGFEYPRSFKTDKQFKLKAPHSDKIVICPKCNGSGVAKCEGCHKREFTEIKSGTDAIKRTCSSYNCRCECRLLPACKTCSGAALLETNKNVHVSFKAKKSRFLHTPHDESDLPSNVVYGSVGVRVYWEDVALDLEKNEPCQVTPVGFKKLRIGRKPAMNLAIGSEQLVKEHAVEIADAEEKVQTRIIFQRQKVKAVPVCRVEYEYKGQEKILFTTGNTHQVFFKDHN